MAQVPGLSRIPQLNSFLYFWRLETGAKVVGYLEAILGPIPFIVGIISSLLHSAAYYESTGFYYSLHMYAVEEIYADIFGLFQFILAIYLLVGIYQRKPSYVKAWVLIHIIYLCLSIFLILVFIIYLFFGYFNLFLVEETIYTVIQIYFVLVVYSYYRDTRPGNLVDME